MLYQERVLASVEETGREMYRLAFAWKEDAAPYVSMSLQEYFNLLKNIPYRPDPSGIELLQRPYYTFTETGKGGDCDDKAICAGAYAHLRGIPFHFVAVSKSLDKPLHHVYTEYQIGSELVPFDPTYAYNVLGRPMGDFPIRQVL